MKGYNLYLTKKEGSALMFWLNTLILNKDFPLSSEGKKELAPIARKVTWKVIPPMRPKKSKTKHPRVG